MSEALSSVQITVDGRVVVDAVYTSLQVSQALGRADDLNITLSATGPRPPSVLAVPGSTGQFITGDVVLPDAKQGHD